MTTERDDETTGDDDVDIVDGSSSSALAAEWRERPDDPDLSQDLGYQWIPFEVFGAEEQADQFLILPEDVGLLTDDAYLVVDPDSLENLAEWT